MKSESVSAGNPASKVTAALLIISAIAETVRELGSVPAGHLYAHLMGKLTHEQFEKVVASLERSGLVKQTPAHLLVWTGPAAVSENLAPQLGSILAAPGQERAL